MRLKVLAARDAAIQVGGAGRPPAACFAGRKGWGMLLTGARRMRHAVVAMRLCEAADVTCMGAIEEAQVRSMRQRSPTQEHCACMRPTAQRPTGAVPRRPLRRRGGHPQGVVHEARSRVREVAKNAAAYRKLLQDLLVQAMRKLGEPTAVVRCRQVSELVMRGRGRLNAAQVACQLGRVSALSPIKQVPAHS